jgi:hypothetical protein
MFMFMSKNPGAPLKCGGTHVGFSPAVPDFLCHTAAFRLSPSYDEFT